MKWRMWLWHATNHPENREALCNYSSFCVSIYMYKEKHLSGISHTFKCIVQYCQFNTTQTQEDSTKPTEKVVLSKTINVTQSKLPWNCHSKHRCDFSWIKTSIVFFFFWWLIILQICLIKQWTIKEMLTAFTSTTCIFFSFSASQHWILSSSMHFFSRWNASTLFSYSKSDQI